MAHLLNRLQNESGCVACLEGGSEDAMAVMALPGKYRKRLRGTNMQGRLDGEARRRERVIRMDDEPAPRLTGVPLAGKNGVWQERKYPDMDDLRLAA